MKVSINRPTRVRITREVVHYVKEWRKHFGLSVDKLGEVAGISGSMISQLERGKTTYTQNTLEALAKAMHLQPWQLLACGPDENQELWRTVMNRSDRRALLDGVDEAELPVLEEMLNNNCEAAVKSWSALSQKKTREEPSKAR
jgi:transcriptional regulator with XRE-family HTH domain